MMPEQAERRHHNIGRSAACSALVADGLARATGQFVGLFTARPAGPGAAKREQLAMGDGKLLLQLTDAAAQFSLPIAMVAEAGAEHGDDAGLASGRLRRCRLSGADVLGALPLDAPAARRPRSPTRRCPGWSGCPGGRAGA